MGQQKCFRKKEHRGMETGSALYLGKMRSKGSSRRGFHNNNIYSALKIFIYLSFIKKIWSSVWKLPLMIFCPDFTINDIQFI